MDPVVLRIMYATIVALVLSWAVVAPGVVEMYRQRWKDEKAAREKAEGKLDRRWQAVQKQRERWLDEHRQLAAARIEIGNLNSALEMEQKNLSVTQEYLRYYIEECANYGESLDSSLRWNDGCGGQTPSGQTQAGQAYVSAPTGAEMSILPCVAGCAVVQAHKWILDRKMQEIEAWRRQAGNLNEKMEEVKARAEDLKEELTREFEELTVGVCPAPQFTEYGEAYDPKPRVEERDEQA